MEELINKYLNIRKKIKALSFVWYLTSWDSETEAPIKCFDLRSEQTGVLAEIEHDILMNEQNKQIHR